MAFLPRHLKLIQPVFTLPNNAFQLSSLPFSPLPLVNDLPPQGIHILFPLSNEILLLRLSPRNSTDTNERSPITKQSSCSTGTSN